ncbi:Lnb N-terminal periplasmic domain-containing protein [Sediminibacterium soli]|uniref:Lnb N-terminal periplasmic domain-containing protein n=1 Tax=Sediminibacterium soli TaxID=2698829 RepID=UPI00137AC6D1|nr:DUF4105 domain-containing protein [Sediminibacterium soli]NCI47279.1 DUF4105 domain-containing protein [Sediminibacterium soli]
MKQFFSCLLCVFSFVWCVGQGDSVHLRVSLLTCAPGEELYSVFGHTAIRITDSLQRTDLVYNWGTFDFDDPDFYTKFVRGKLDYSLSVSDFAQFMYEYDVTQRDVTEQELQLSGGQKIQIRNAILRNLQFNNRFYKYDFLKDNCTTRARDMLAQQAGMTVVQALVPEGTSYRDMLHEYLDRQHMGWTKLGIDLLMGAPADKPVSVNGSLFLPDYLMKGVAVSSLKTDKRVILRTAKTETTGSSQWPLRVLSVLCAGILLLSFVKTKTAKKLTAFFDFLLCLVTGLIGCILLFTWFGTDHRSFAYNHNIFWALPTNLVAAFFVWKHNARMKTYFFAAGVVYGLLLIAWYWLPQSLNPALIPVVLLLFLRFVRLAKP